jgi:serine/threonine-protein kinase RsbW
VKSGTAVTEETLRPAPVRSWGVPFSPAAVRDARTDVTVELRRSGVPQRVIDDARLVVSELLGNALRHARPIPDCGLVLTLELLSDAVRLAVSDGGSATLPTLLHAPGLAPSGRGLSIVRTLTREWGVREGVQGNTVFGVLAIA